MIRQKIKIHIKKIIFVILLIIFLLIIKHLYGIFVQPFIDPYFFKIDNVEKIIGMKLPSALMLEYEIEPEPSYRFAGTRGIKKIFACLQIEQDDYESLKEKKYFNECTPVWSKEEHIKNYMNLDDFEEMRIIYYITPLSENVYHGILPIYHSGPTTSIFIVIAKMKDDLYLESSYYFYRLYVFNEI